VNRLRVAVVGAGHLGRIHARLLSSIQEVELVGVVDPVAQVRNRVAAEFSTRAFASHHEIVDKVDAAVVATTTDHHWDVGVDLLNRGIHTLIEKPIARTVLEADQLVAAASRSNVVLQIGHVERFNAAWQAATPFIRRPVFIEAVRSGGYTFRSTDIGAVLDLMIHDLDLVLSIVRSEVIKVDAVGTTIFGPHEDMAHAHLKFANGCIANLNASRTSFLAQRKMQIVSERAYVGVDFAEQTAKLIRPSKEVMRREIDVRQLDVEQRQRMQHNLFTDLLPVRELTVEQNNAIFDEQCDFLHCIRTGDTPQVSGLQARDHLVVAEQILEQIREAPQTKRFQQMSQRAKHAA
jgi:predicted dehydrogenase